MEKYIESLKQPSYLNADLITYKVLFSYFRKTFIMPSELKLELNSYYENQISKHKLGVFFARTETINIKSYDSTFLHLIGFKGNKHLLLAKDKNINLYNKDKKFIVQIEKIKSLSWILETLKKPTFIFSSIGVKKVSKVYADLIFVRKKKGTYHYVSLKKISSSSLLKNDYVISSHYPLTDSNKFNNMFKKNKAIYVKPLKLKKNDIRICKSDLPRKVS